MRLNRVLLLAASINMAMLAIAFTISCSGSDGSSGQPGQPGSQCGVEDGNFVCDGVVIGPIGGGPSGLDCDFNLLGQLVCNGQIIGDGADNCDISVVGEGATALMVDCGAGGRFGMCGNDVFMFEEKFCDYGTVRANLVCSGDEGKSLPGYKGANPNLGEACSAGALSGTTKDCGAREHFWSVSANADAKTSGGDYSCKLSPLYRECGEGDDAVVFEVGKDMNVYDVVLGNFKAAAKDSLYIFEKATRICKNGELAACPAGWIPKVPSTLSNAPEECMPAVNYAACVNNSGDTVDVFDARTSVCENRGTENARIKACEITVPVHGGEPDYTPATYNPYEPKAVSSGSSYDDKRDWYYEECELNREFRECIDNGKEVKSVFFKKNYVCKNYGNSNPTIEECKNGMTPNGLIDETDPLGWTACIDGKKQCEDDRKGKFIDNACYFSLKHACYAKNGDPATGTGVPTCAFNEKSTETNIIDKWENTSGTKCSDYTAAAAGDYTDAIGGTGVGLWTAAREKDKYWTTAGGDDMNPCFDNAKQACELVEDGLWMLANPNATKHNDDNSCKKLNTLNRKECLDNGFYWGNLADQTSGGSCARTPELAKNHCEQTLGYFGVTSSGPGYRIHRYTWQSSTNTCISIANTYRTQSSCRSAGFYWDPRVNIGVCFYDVTDAGKECLDNDVNSTNTAFTQGICSAADDDLLCTAASKTGCRKDASGTTPSCGSWNGYYWNTTGSGSCDACTGTGNTSPAGSDACGRQCNTTEELDTGADAGAIPPVAGCIAHNCASPNTWNNSGTVNGTTHTAGASYSCKLPTCGSGYASAAAGDEAAGKCEDRCVSGTWDDATPTNGCK